MILKTLACEITLSPGSRDCETPLGIGIPDIVEYCDTSYTEREEKRATQTIPLWV
jgi:hypothetical protein